MYLDERLPILKWPILGNPVSRNKCIASMLTMRKIDGIETGRSLPPHKNEQLIKTPACS